MRQAQEPWEVLRADTTADERVSQAEYKHRSQREQRTQSAQSETALLLSNCGRILMGMQHYRIGSFELIACHIGKERRSLLWEMITCCVSSREQKQRKRRRDIVQEIQQTQAKRLVGCVIPRVQMRKKQYRRQLSSASIKRKSDQTEESSLYYEKKKKKACLASEMI